MTTDPQADARDRLFALIASIPGSGAFDWCTPARELLDQIAVSSAVAQSAPADRAAAVASCPGRELDPNPCRCPCYGCKHHCSAHNPDEVLDSGVAPAKTALRDRIAGALHGDQTPAPTLPWAEELPLDREYFLRRADAVLAVLPAPFESALPSQTGPKADSKSATDQSVCVCGHTRGEHLVVSGRLLCDTCDPDSTENLTCTGFEAL